MLGASNVWLLKRPIEQLFTSRKLALDLHCGPGRAYLRPGGFLWWRYCALADVIEPGRSYGIVVLMDLGSDLLYGAPAEELAEFLRDRIRGWTAHGARVAVVPVFEETISTLGPLTFPALKGVFYPRSKLALDELAAGAAEINRSLRELAKDETELVLMEGCSSYVGPDRLHYIHRAAFLERLRRVIEKPRV